MLFSCCTIVVVIFESLGDEILNRGYEIDRGGGRGEEFLGIMGGGGGLQLGSRNPGPISDQSMNVFGILFHTFKIHTHFSDLVSRIHARFCKMHTPFQTFRPK